VKALGGHRGGVRAVVVVTILALVGAVAFGLWHVVVGWWLHGNPRAGAFGAVLVVVAAVALATEVAVVRRTTRSRF
jgi:hypothetical protein